MKTDRHPKYYPAAKVTCACGNSFTTGSTEPELTVELCSNCHPFFTGKSNLVDTAGRIDRFRARSARSSKLAEARKKRVADKQAKAAAAARLAKGTSGTAKSA
ncbi:MAG: 50S ribosomal protein L31 [Candidatus Andersenbacteria bacterium]